MAKDKDYNRMIHSARWLRLRVDVLSAHPLCQRCEAEGRVSAAGEVHHVRPVEEGRTAGEKERLMFDPRNLKALCRSCHSLTHKEMRSHSKESVAKRRRKEAKEAISRFFGDGGGGESV